MRLRIHQTGRILALISTLSLLAACGGDTAANGKAPTCQDGYGLVQKDGKATCALLQGAFPLACGVGTYVTKDGECLPLPEGFKWPCKAGEVLKDDLKTCLPATKPPTCPVGSALDEYTGDCVKECPVGFSVDANGTDCDPVPVPTYICQNGSEAPGNDPAQCPHVCRGGYDYNEETGACEKACPIGQTVSADGNSCVSVSASPTGGTLVVTQDGSTPKPAIILGDSTNVPASTFLFTTDGTQENQLVNGLTLSNCLLAAAGTRADCSDGVPGADAVAMDVKITYVDQNGSTVTKTGFLNNGNVSFNGLDFRVLKGTPQTLKVTIDTNRVSSASGVASGSKIQLNVVGVTAVGEGSGATANIVYTTAGDAIVVGNPMTLRKTKPTVSLASGSPSGAAVPGFSEGMRVNATADAHGFVDLNEVLFKVTSTDNAGSGWNAGPAFGAGSGKWKLYDAADPSTPIDYYVYSYPTSGTGPIKYVSFSRYGNGADREPLQIGAGQTRIFVLKVDTSGASASQDDAFRIDIPDETEAAAAGLHAIVWDDDVEATDIDGSLIKNLPITGGTLVF